MQAFVTTIAPMLLTSLKFYTATPFGRCWLAIETLPMLLVVILLLSIAPKAWAADAMLTGRVTQVLDGDTLDVLLATGRIRVRLHGIDAPERNQSGGNDARLWLRQRTLNREVRLQPVSQDRYDRMLAIVFLDAMNVNRDLLNSGNAWAFRQFLRSADRDYCALEANARTARRGLWAQQVSHAPWEFRQTSGKGPFTSFMHQSAADCWRLRKRP